MDRCITSALNGNFYLLRGVWAPTRDLTVAGLLNHGPATPTCLNAKGVLSQP